jgi:hypothetical protein
MFLMLFWLVSPYGRVGADRRFGETYCLHLQNQRVGGPHSLQTENMFLSNGGRPNTVHRSRVDPCGV